MSLFEQVIFICNGICSISAAIVLIVKPIREKILGTKEIRDGQKCLLRASMLSTYYKNHENKQIRQHEKENFVYEYKAYKALGGNSFIDDIYHEIREWEVIS